jgi:hypothetical protein
MANFSVSGLESAKAPMALTYQPTDAGEQAGVLVACDRSAEITGGHRVPAIRRAARRTPSTMCR